MLKVENKLSILFWTISIEHAAPFLPKEYRLKKQRPRNLFFVLLFSFFYYKSTRNFLILAIEDVKAYQKPFATLISTQGNCMLKLVHFFFFNNKHVIIIANLQC